MIAKVAIRVLLRLIGAIWFCAYLPVVSARPLEPTLVCHLLRLAPGSTFHIVIMDLDGSNRKQLTRGGKINEHPAWSPDGERIAYVADGVLMIVDCDGENSNALPLRELRGLQDPAWSPDGTNLVFAASDAIDWRHNIWLFNVATGKTIQLTNKGDNTRPTWTPDGKRIVFASDRDPQFWLPDPAAPLGFFVTKDIYIMDESGRGITNLTETQTDEMDPIVSPDGSQIAFAGQDKGDTRRQLYIMEITGRGRTRLTNFEVGSVFKPSWSANGHQIFFELNLPDRCGIYASSLDGVNIRPIVDEVGSLWGHPDLFDPSSLGVSPAGKASSTWGNLKYRHR